ncbi:6-bladed beta-propeller [Phocaeicola sp.]
MKVVNAIFCITSVLLVCCCSHRPEYEKRYSSQDNVIRVENELKKIDTGENYITIFGTPYVLNDYLIISDYNSLDKLIYIFDNNTFEYITGIGNRGQGPGEIANLGSIVTNEKENLFYVVDNGRQKILSYSIDSVLVNPYYNPEEKATFGEKAFPQVFQYVNDTLSFALFFKGSDDGDYTPVVSKWNMLTGKTVFMNYAGHPQIKRKRVSFASSVEHGIYVEAYWYHDLMSLCTLDGNLKCNLYGGNWSDKTSNRNRYFRNVAFCDDKIIASYLGGERLSGQQGGQKVNYPTDLVVFDLDGNYLATLGVGYPIITFCYDKGHNRIILALDNEMQFAYLNLDNLI